MQAIAKIRLARGEVGFYDDLTGIHLTRAKPDRYIYENMNTKNIRRGIKFGRLELVSGTLSKKKQEEEKAEKAPKKTSKKETQKEKEQEAIQKASFEKGSGEISIEPDLSSKDIEDLKQGKRDDSKKTSSKKGKKKK